MAGYDIAAFRGLQATVQSEQIRNAVYNGDNYLVVPLIMMIGNKVITSQNSDGPELVPASVLASSPSEWNNRPVVMGHPGTATGSANYPDTLEEYAFGVLFNTTFSDSKLKSEAWVSETRASLIGNDAIALMKAYKNGTQTEVSLGAFITLDQEDGEVDGVSYEYKWTSLSSDHLAMLPLGTIGACSIQKGCGSMRINEQTKGGGDSVDAKVSVTAEDSMPDDKILSNGNEHATREKKPNVSVPSWMVGLSKYEPSIGGKIQSVFRSNMTHRDLEQSLNKALVRVVPGFYRVIDVDQDEGLVYYGTEFYDDEYVTYLYQRSFTRSNGDIALADDQVEISVDVTYLPVTSLEENKSSRSCPCEVAQLMKGEHKVETSEKVKDLVTKLISHRSSLKEHRQKLESMGEGVLSALVEVDTLLPADSKPCAKVEEKHTSAFLGSSSEVVQTGLEQRQDQPAVETIITAETRQYASMTDLSPEDQQFVKQAQEARTVVKAGIVETLSSRQGFSKSDLELKTVDELKQLVAFAGLGSSQGVTDYAIPHRQTGKESPDRVPTMRELVSGKEAN